MSDGVVPCTAQEALTHDCNEGQCVVETLINSQVKHCICPEGTDGQYCEDMYVDPSLFASTQYDGKTVVTIAVVCSVLLVVIAGLVILLVVVRKLRQHRRRANDSLPFAATSTVSSGGATSNHGNGNVNAAENGTGGIPRNNTQEKLNTSAVASHM